MKIKDIKNNLKSEHAEKSVPDVFSRAKQAPINRLLTGEEPLKAFDKRTAVRLLWIALALFLVCALAFSALALMQGGSSAPVSSYVRLSIESEDGTTVYGFLLSDESVSACVLESSGGDAPYTHITDYDENIKYAITDVYQAKNNDKVRVCVICDNSAFASELASALAQNIKYGANAPQNMVVSQSVNDAAVTAQLASLLSLGQNPSADEIVKAYFEKFA